MKEYIYYHDEPFWRISHLNKHMGKNFHFSDFWYDLTCHDIAPYAEDYAEELIRNATEDIPGMEAYKATFCKYFTFWHISLYHRGKKKQNYLITPYYIVYVNKTYTEIQSINDIVNLLNKLAADVKQTKK